MFGDCCQIDWMCPDTGRSLEFTDESRAKPYTPIGKHSTSTGLGDSITINDGSTNVPDGSPESKGSKQSALVLERLSTAPTVARPIQLFQRSELLNLNQLINQRKRSCSLLSVECQRREILIGKAFMTSTANLQQLGEKYRQHMRELDRIERLVQVWENKRTSRQSTRRYCSPAGRL